MSDDKSWARPPLRFAPGKKRTLTIKDAHLADILSNTAYALIDGAMGTELQARGLEAGELPELLNLTAPQEITDIHRAYIAAGAEIITTNTFGANRAKLGTSASVAEVFTAAIACAKDAEAPYIAADIGPTGQLLQPMGTLSFEDAYDLFAEQAIAAEAAGANLFIIETMADIAEAKAAILACKENTSLPIFCTMTFGEDGRTFLGTTPEVAALTLSALGVNALGINCSLGPRDVAPLLSRMIPYSRVPLMVQANAGLPRMSGGKTVYDIAPEEYVAAVAEMVDQGVSIIGGCCGTTPAYTKAEKELLSRRPAMPSSHAQSHDFAVTSAQAYTKLGPRDVGVIGERINPTGKKLMKEALRSKNLDYVLKLALEQTEAGAQILDINAGLPEIDEKNMMLTLVNQVSAVSSLPLQIDSAVPETVAQAVRVYAGKPLINSTNGRKDVMDAIIPLAAHYGCALVGLTIDEEGIPETAEGRLKIATRIVERAADFGIPPEDIAIDCLAMAASTDQNAPAEILRGIRLVKKNLPGVRCVLGVSNISFGLPFRPLINATFLSAAFGAGLDLAIINPCQQRIMDVVRSWRVLSGEDKDAQTYVPLYVNRSDKPAALPQTKDAGHPTQEQDAGHPAQEPLADTHDKHEGTEDLSHKTSEEQIFDLVLAGRAAPIPQLIDQVLQDHDVMYAINSVLIPALDEVGKRFEAGSFFLPQLMASAEAAKAGFNHIKENHTSTSVANKGKIALCTVKGDIHDIGKNIVKMLLENYGYEVHDLGRDVDPEVFCDAVVKNHIKLAGLSALMTATVPAMAETIELLHKRAPWCTIMVGGAVLNPEYAQMVGADYYAKDANESARIAQEVLG
ncbi:MAG: homocysteine S-methyltransferase family protein [Atopobiaceae bacterium]|jgi:5-methyltetrahydrofolate--homocysteine methyltransferase